MTSYDLDGMRVTVGIPKLVAKGIGHLWFPRIFRFGTGELLIKHSIAADSGNLTLTGSGMHLSFDDGETWDFHYDVSEGPEVATPRADGSLLGVVFRTYGAVSGSMRDVRGHKVRLEDGGRRYVLEPWEASFSGLPRDLGRHEIKGQHGALWRPELVVHGDIVDLGSELFGTAYVTFAGDTKYSLDRDRLRRWRRYLAVPLHDRDTGRHGRCAGRSMRTLNHPAREWRTDVRLPRWGRNRQPPLAHLQCGPRTNLVAGRAIAGG